MNRLYSTTSKALVVVFVAVGFPAGAFSGSQFTSVATSTFGVQQQGTKSWGNPIWGNINSNTDPTPKLDLIIPTNSAQPLVYVNNGSDTFTLIPNGTSNGQSGIFLPSGYGTVADWRGFAFGDYDGDGKLDLYIAVNYASSPLKSNLLFKGTAGPPAQTYFTWVSTDVALNSDAQQGQSGFWVDSNKNGNLELFVKNYFAGTISGANRLYEWPGTAFGNIIGAGSFLELAVHQDFALPQDGHGVICSFYDSGYDGDMDVAFSSFRKALYLKSGSIYNEDTVSIYPVKGEICLGLAWGDYNNDSYPDLYIASGTLDSNDCKNTPCLRTLLV